MNPVNLFSIGHGHKSPQEFISELQSFNIQYLVDVRSCPFSKWAPDFNQGIIEQTLAAANIRYTYMGDTIGGRPVNDDCYDEDGRFDYHKMAEMPSFQKGLLRLIDANEKGYRVAVMCSESDPSECHRSKLIGRELCFEHDIDMHHIIAPSQAVSEWDIINSLTNGEWSKHGPTEPELSFSESELGHTNTPPYFKSQKVYRKQPEYEDFYD